MRRPIDARPSMGRLGPSEVLAYYAPPPAYYGSPSLSFGVTVPLQVSRARGLRKKVRSFT